MKTVFVAAWLVVAGASMPALAQHLPPSGGPYPPPFTATLSNNTPLAFGMDAEGAARALPDGSNVPRKARRDLRQPRHPFAATVP